ALLRRSLATTGELLRPLPKSLSENWAGCCGRGFWLWTRRRDRGIPAAGCDGRANAVHRQKTRRPEGFRGWSKMHKECSPSSRLAIRPFLRKQHPAEFSDRL